MNNKLKPGGTTNIGKGLFVALKILADRRYKNPVTSVFLLSDGEDDKGEDYIEGVVEEWKGRTGAYTLNTFGFGKDHDSDLMTCLADDGDGNFYFIARNEDIGTYFVHCLGRLFSFLAENVTINVSPTFSPGLENIRIEQAFGGEDWW